MNILLFGISNVGKTTIGKVLAIKLEYKFFDVDDKVKEIFGTIDEFNKNPSMVRSLIKQDMILTELEHSCDYVVAVSPLHDVDLLLANLNINTYYAFELRDSAENIMDRLVFTDENDEIDLDYTSLAKTKYRDYYINDIKEDCIYFSKIYNDIIDESIYMNNKSIDDIVIEICDRISKFQ